MTSAREEVDEENDDIEPYPFGPARRLELHPRFAELRATKPVAEVRLPYGGRAWLLTRYADIKTAMNDPRFRRTTPEDPDVPRTTEDYPASRESLLTAPPQEHMRLRRLVMKAFTHREIEKLREQAQVIVDGLIDDMVERGSPADLGEAIAWQLPIRIICKILGGDVADKDRFAKWAVQVQGSQIGRAHV